MRGLTPRVLLATGFAGCASLVGSCGGKAEDLPMIVDMAVRDAVSVSVNGGALPHSARTDCSLSSLEARGSAGGHLEHDRSWGPPTKATGPS